MELAEEVQEGDGRRMKDDEAAMTKSRQADFM